MNNSISKNIKKIKIKIQKTAEKYKKDKKKIRLLAVSKQKSIIEIEKAINSNQFDFAENYAQEAIKKIKILNKKKYKIIWHFIGKIQSNKTKIIAQNFSWCHSICNSRIAIKLNNYRTKELLPLNSLIQINIKKNNEIDDKEIYNISDIIKSLPNLKLRGIMAIPNKLNKNKEKEIKATYKKIEKIYNKLKEKYSSIDTLSLGMSNDIRIAIKNGSNMLRIGKSIFGNRK
ncbi:Pyridoxal phosphate homeostasis protein [Buchnera aphidicola (Neophyllaphis podocarpi)]|uniref:YggS family pyridoxal phosphate-dependent enzyme n=1 Tax=Buchnera aphidicola TaxID=9 RepID=UPI0031B89C82